MKNRIIKILSFIIISILLISSVSFANSVEYRGESEGVISTPNDFFGNFGELLPGDVVEDYAYIKNLTNDEIEVFFKTEPLSREEYNSETDYLLLEKLKLKITMKKSGSEETELIYDGNLGAGTLSEYISLGKYKRNFDGKFMFRIEVPKELKNSFTLSETKVKWVFAVTKEDNSQGDNEGDNEGRTPGEEIPGEKTPGGETPGGETSGDKTQDSKTLNNKTQDNNSIINAQTSDNIIYIISILGFVILLYISVYIIRNRRRINEKEQ